MKNGQLIAPHETYDLHELLVLRSVSATKTSVMSGLVKDEELKAIMQQEFNNCQEHLKELQSLLESSVLAKQTAKESSDNYVSPRH